MNCCIHEWLAVRQREQKEVHPLEKDGLSVLQRLLVVYARRVLILMGTTKLVPQAVVAGPWNGLLDSLQSQLALGS